MKNLGTQTTALPLALVLWQSYCNSSNTPAACVKPYKYNRMPYEHTTTPTMLPPATANTARRGLRFIELTPEHWVSPSTPSRPPPPCLNLFESSPHYCLPSADLSPWKPSRTAYAHRQQFLARFPIHQCLEMLEGPRGRTVYLTVVAVSLVSGPE